MRRTGIEVVGDVPWGTHFCQFYDTEQDLLDVLVPYFREGLASHEYCLWVTSAPLSKEAAKAALRTAVPDLDEHVAQGRIEILDHRDWYLRSGKLSTSDVLHCWVDRLAAAREQGFEGLRLTGNTFWLEASDWQDFARYEKAVNDVIGQYPMLALCTYSLAKCRTNEILDVVANHEFALVRRGASWVCVENSGQRRLATRLRESEERFSAFMRHSPAIAWLKDAQGRYVYVSESFEKQAGVPLKECQGKTDLEIWPREIAEEFRRNDRQVLATGQPITLIEQTPDAGEGRRYWQSSKFPFRDAAGQVYVGGIGVDVTAVSQADAKIYRQNALLVAINRISHEALTCETEERLGRACLSVAEELTLSQFGFIAELDAAGQLNDLAISNPGWDACRVENRTSHGQLPAGFKARGVFARVILDGKGFFTNEPSAHPDAVGVPPGHPPVKAFLGVPLIRDGKTIGMLGLANRKSGYRDQDLEALQTLAPTIVQVLMRKRAERALAQSERRISLIVDSIADGFFTIDRQWRFTRVNDAAVRHFGKTREEMLGRGLFDVFPLARDTTYETAYRTAMESGVPARFETASMISDRTLEVHVYPGPENLTVLFRDVTERKQAEIELREAHQRAVWLGRFPEENPNPVLRVSANGGVLYCNPAAERLPGWLCQPGGTAPEPVLPLLARALEQCAELREDVVVADKVYSVSAMPFVDERYANVYGIDITERRRVEEALRHAHDELEERVRERTAELRRLNATLQMISDCNQALVRPSTEDDLVRDLCRIIQDRGGYRMAWVGYAEDDQARTVRPVASVGAEDGYLERARVSWADEPRGRGPTGTCIRTRTACFGRDFLTDPEMAPWREEARKRGFRSSIALPLIVDGRAFGALTIYSDRVEVFDEPQSRLLAELADDLAFGIVAVRARRVAEESTRQLRALATELGQAEERERRRLATLLHDHLQQLLVGAKYSLASVAGRPGPRARQAAVDEVVQILDDAIEVTASLTAELSPPTLHESGLVAGLEWLARQMKKKHGLHVDIRADAAAEPAAESVRILLYQAVRELLFNVVKHAGVKRARVGVTRCGDGQVQVAVEDSGAGFEAKRLAVGDAGGSGFGLFSIRERLSHLGGSMSVDSAPGRGTRFSLVAPARAAQAAVTDSPADRSAPPLKAADAPANHAVSKVPRRIRVLLADDHAVLREGLTRLLSEQSDIEVVGETGDGLTAIALARQLRPDVVLMDVSMPRTNGLDATQRLAAEMPSLKIIGLSMHDDAVMGDAMRAAGAAGYVPKSAPPADILTAIRACLASASAGSRNGAKTARRARAASTGRLPHAAARGRKTGPRRRTARPK